MDPCPPLESTAPYQHRLLLVPQVTLRGPLVAVQLLQPHSRLEEKYRSGSKQVSSITAT